MASAATPLLTNTCQALLRTLTSLHLALHDHSPPAAGPRDGAQQPRATMAHSRTRLCRVALLCACGSDGAAPLARPHPGQPGGGAGACGGCAPAPQALPAAALLSSHPGTLALDAVWWLEGQGLCRRVEGAVAAGCRAAACQNAPVQLNRVGCGALRAYLVFEQVQCPASDLFSS